MTSSGGLGSRPLSRQMSCPYCSPHEHHLLACDFADGCDCPPPPIPGITLHTKD